MRYLLGVDGGNTKTDYLLCTEDGTFVDVYRCGTCSHEQMHDSYDGMERTMRQQLEVILTRNHIKPEDIAAGGFGLAGADLPVQVAELTKRIEKIGFHRFTVSNDGILGVKAASESGMGVCVVCGTGTVVIGIDENGYILQVGGVGDLSGDRAGGGYILHDVMYHLYAYHFRCGMPSSLFAPVMTQLGIQPDDLLSAVGEHTLLRRNMKDIIQLADQAACAGDAVAKKIFDTMGTTMGHSAAGCIRRLSFGGMGTVSHPLQIVLVGSIWHKINYSGLKESFLQTTQELSQKSVQLVPLMAPAAVGGVLWAKEMLSGPVEKTYRQRILSELTLERYESLVLHEQ